MRERNAKTYKILVGIVTGGYRLGETDVAWMIILEMIIKKCRIIL